MRCPNCDTRMEDMGYGDEKCPECGHVEYSESEEDFNKRMNRLNNIKKDSSDQISEGIEMGDLGRLVKPEMTIDEFRSKMGEDKDIVVIGFTVLGKAPADDMVNFIEKSYDWVLDADISSGETSDGNYIVFVELQRKPESAEHIYTMLEDLMNLTDQKVEDWTFSYYKGVEKLPVTLENLEKTIIKTPEEYEAKTSLDLDEAIELNKLRALSGVQIKPTKVTDLQILDLQIAAGIK